jgi:uncharacterized SAM-binding protein YcdF (DUF218 family)
VSRRVLRWVGGTALVVFLVAAFTPAVEGVASWLAPDRPAERADAIVVLGAGGLTAEGGLTDTSLRGAMRGITLFRQGWAALVVFSGSREGTGTEAEARAAFARQAGIPEAAIVAAPPAYTTREEAVRIQALLRPRGIRKILLVVDGPGMRRAMKVFERVGFEVVPAPWTSEWNLDEGPEARLAHLRAITMEIAAGLYYRAMGYI